MFYKLTNDNSFYNPLKDYKDVLVPVRCFTCGKLVADKFAEYSERVQTGG